jgi:hypothetical protein
MADQHPGNPQPELTIGSTTTWHFAAARVEAGAPAAYRLARYRTAEGQTHLNPAQWHCLPAMRRRAGRFQTGYCAPDQSASILDSLPILHFQGTRL